MLFQATEEHFFERFCVAVGRRDLLAGRSGEQVGEHASGDVALRRALAAIFATRTQAEWVQLFVAVDVPGGPVHDPQSLVTDPQFLVRTDMVEHDHPDAGPLRLLGTPIHSGEPPVRPAPAPGRGDDTDDVLSGVLGYDERRIAALRADGAVG